MVIISGMETYLSKKKEGKKFHDPLAASVAFDESICQFKEVRMYSERNQWGCVEQQGTNTFISIHADHEAFLKTLCCIRLED